MSEALNLIYDVLDVFSGKKTSLKEKTGLVDLLAREREKVQAVQCWKDCHLPAWSGGCPYLNVNGKACRYYGSNYEEEDDEHNND